MARKTPWTQEEWNLVVAAFQAAKTADPTSGRKQLVEAAQAVLPEERRMSMNGGSPFDRYNDIMDRIGAQEAAAIVASHPPKAARVVKEEVKVPAKAVEAKSNLTDLLAQVKQVEKAIQERVAEEKVEVGTLKAANAKLTHENLHGTKLLDSALVENAKLKAKITELQGPGSLTALVEAMKAELLANQVVQTMALIRYFETGERPDGTSLVKGSEGGQATQVPTKALEAAKSPETALLETLRSPSLEAQKKHDPSPTPSPVAKIRRKVLICGVPENQLQYFRTNLPEINFQAFDPNKPHFKDGPADADLCILVRNGVVSHSASNAFLTKYGKGKVIQVRKGQNRLMEVVKNHMSLA